MGGPIVAYHQFLSEDDLVVLQVERKGQKAKQTFVFDGFDSMEKVAIENPDIPVSVWETLSTMQNEVNAAQGIG